MTGSERQAILFGFGIPPKSVESKRGALHLILFDTSPLKGFVQMCTLCTFCARGEPRERKELKRFRVHKVHEMCTLCTIGNEPTTR